MKIKVLYFAQLRDIFGCDNQELDLPEGISVGQVEQMLRCKAGTEKLNGLIFKKAVNEEWVGDAQPLKQNDVLVLLPPVSGG